MYILIYIKSQVIMYAKLMQIELMFSILYGIILLIL